LYAKDAKNRGKKFYSTETARLRSVSIEAGGRVLLQFQQAEYFDYVKTNMALDFPDPMDGCLRDEVHPHGRLEPLAQSGLANHTGISGLVFSGIRIWLCSKGHSRPDSSSSINVLMSAP
jgi:hypothetical protein